MPSALEKSLARILDDDGADALGLLAASLEHEDDALGQLLAIAQRRPTDPVGPRATWLMQTLLKQGATPDANVAAGLVKLIKATDHWLVQLHALQMLSRADVFELVPKRSYRPLAAAALPLVSAENGFVKAWAVNALGLVGGGLPEAMRRRVREALTQGETSGSAAVKARIRRLRNDGGLEWMDG